MKKYFQIFLTALLCFSSITATSTLNESTEESVPKVKVLLIMDDNFGVSYKIAHKGILSIKEQFENYGWELVIAGPKDTLVSCEWGGKNFDNKPIAVDFKIAEINEISKYNALVIMPGNSYQNLGKNIKMTGLIQAAIDRDLVVAAFCRGVSLLAAADVLKGRTVIGNMDYKDAYEVAGAEYIKFYKKGIREFHDVTPPIADGNIITTVRSLYYRNQMCDRIRQAIDKNRADVSYKKMIGLGDEAAWSCKSEYYATGIGWSDLDNDGWIDIVVSNGIDVREQPVIAYFNKKGKLANSPDWQSKYKLPSGNLFLTDLNSDNYPEIIISHLGISKKGFTPGSHVIFNNDPKDAISMEPIWKSPVANGFSCTGGDFDGDGDMDLAFGQGVNAIKAENKKIQHIVIFANNAGKISDTPVWQSDDIYLINDICSIDIDNDGDLDLCISGKGYGISVFYNTDGILETSPSWSTNSITGARQMAFGDVDGDGFQELAVAVPAPKFLSEGGKFCLFKNNKGVLDREPYWECEQYKEPSCVTWADVDADGDLDLTGGGFFGYLGIFENEDGKLSTSMTWKHKEDPKKYWVQQLAWGDYDQDYIINEVRKIKADGKRKLFYIGEKNLQSVSAILLNDKPIDPKKYCYDLTEGWISLAEVPEKSDRLKVVFSWSKDLDLAVTSLYRISIFNNKVTIE